MDIFPEKFLKYLEKNGPMTGLQILKHFPETISDNSLIDKMVAGGKIHKFVNKVGVISYRIGKR